MRRFSQPQYHRLNFARSHIGSASTRLPWLMTMLGGECESEAAVLRSHGVEPLGDLLKLAAQCKVGLRRQSRTFASYRVRQLNQ
jgi:hypothetical protein